MFDPHKVVDTTLERVLESSAVTLPKPKVHERIDTAVHGRERGHDKVGPHTTRTDVDMFSAKGLHIQELIHATK